jgi:membrane protein
VITRLRARFALLDHVVRTYVRYQAAKGDLLAGAVTFYWFLSLFPILLLALYVFRLINGPSAAADVETGLAGYLPIEVVTSISQTIGSQPGTAGVVGAAGLLLAGLGWINALREAVCAVWGHTSTTRNFVVRKVIDAVALVGLLATIVASVFVTGLAGSGPKLLLHHAGVDQTPAAVLFTKALGLVLGGCADVVLFLYLFMRLAHVGAPFRQVLRGAVLGAVGFGVLKLGGGYYFTHTTSRGKATYGTLAVVVGLLLFLNLMSRLVLYAAAFAVTASPEQPTEGGVVEQRDLSAVPASEPAGAGKVRLAARATAAAGGLVLVAVSVYAARTLQRLVRR